MTNIATELLEFYKTHEWCRNDWTRQIRGKTHYCMQSAINELHPNESEAGYPRSQLNERLLKVAHHMTLTVNDQMCRSKRDAIKWLERAAEVEL